MISSATSRLPAPLGPRRWCPQAGAGRPSEGKASKRLKERDTDHSHTDSGEGRVHAVAAFCGVVWMEGKCRGGAQPHVAARPTAWRGVESRGRGEKKRRQHRKEVGGEKRSDCLSRSVRTAGSCSATRHSFVQSSQSSCRLSVSRFGEKERRECWCECESCV